jgi:hypothetical protein
MTSGILINSSIIAEMFLAANGYIENVKRNNTGSLLIMKISAILKGSVCVLGLVGVGNFFAAPANAGDAAARGAVTIVRPSGASVSVSAELTAPTSAYFTGPALLVTPLYNGTIGANDESVVSLQIDPGAVVNLVSPPSSTIEAAIAAKIDAGIATSVEDLAALIRAASVNGGLE